MTTLIKNVQIIDGTGEKAKSADVLIKGDRISAIGNFNKKTADLIIDGRGAYLSPGFINLNTDSDHYLSIFDNKEQQDFLMQGVTTIIGGLCGASLAPLLYGSLESIRKWANPEKINVNWRTMDEFLDNLDQSPLGVNFATLVGHATIRRALIGENLRDLTLKEIEVFKDIISKALESGAYGFSTGLGYAHARQTPYSELKALLEPVVRQAAVYATHLRNDEEGLLSSVDETIHLARETGVRVLISHFRPLYKFEDEWERALSLIEADVSLRIHADLYPFDHSVLPIYRLLPLWAQNGPLELMMHHLENKSMRERIVGALPRLKGDEITISAAPQNEYLVGKTLRDFCNTRQIKSVKEGLVELMLLAKLKAMVIFKNINLDVLLRNLHRPSILVASNSASLRDDVEVLKPERALKTFPRFLELVQEKNLMPLEMAVKKITSLPASIIGLEDRGVIKDRAFADLVIFKDGEIKTVLVNGEVAFDGGKITSKLSGKVLRKN